METINLIKKLKSAKIVPHVILSESKHRFIEKCTHAGLKDGDLYYYDGGQNDFKPEEGKIYLFV